ncbi:MAG: zinc ribbon domain-containing protein [Acidobacteriota bacterium]
MDPVLRSLIRYQELSLELDRLNTLLEQIPIKARSIDTELQAAAGALEQARAQATACQKRRRDQEAELQDLEARLQKYNSQLMQVKTNTEYKAMQAEIEGVKRSVGSVEERILMLLDEIDAAESRVAEEERLFEERKQEAARHKEELRRDEEKVSTEVSRLEKEKDSARSVLGADVLDLFERIAAIRNGIAVARASEHRCQECKVRLRPQVFAEVKKNDRIIQCDSCNRILFHIEQAPAAGSVA